MMVEKCRLSCLKPGDHLRWRGEIRCIESMSRFRYTNLYLVFLQGDQEPKTIRDSEWPVPDAQELAEHVAARL